jgi:hypothetical protein
MIVGIRVSTSSAAYRRRSCRCSSEAVGKCRELVCLDGPARGIQQPHHAVKSLQRIPGRVAVQRRRCRIGRVLGGIERGDRTLVGVALSPYPVPKFVVATVEAVGPLGESREVVVLDGIVSVVEHNQRVVEVVGRIVETPTTECRGVVESLFCPVEVRDDPLAGVALGPDGPAGCCRVVKHGSAALLGEFDSSLATFQRVIVLAGITALPGRIEMYLNCPGVMSERTQRHA